MSQNTGELPFSTLVNISDYNIDSLESEIRADRYCSQLLKHFHQWLLNDKKYEALEAGKLAAGADYFLREFLVGARRQNIFNATAEQLRQFGGNWYIISNLEPNIPELKPMLLGAADFYAYAAEQKLVNIETADAFATVAQETGYFQTRIDEFYQLVDDGYKAWDQACPLG